MTHFKLTVRNPKGRPLKSVALYAGDRKLQEWERPPYAVPVPNASLAGVGVRAVVGDEAGNQVTGVLPRGASGPPELTAQGGRSMCMGPLRLSRS